MAEAKMELTIGGNKFLAEGTQAWLSAEVERFLAELPTDPCPGSTGATGGAAPATDVSSEEKQSTTLPTFLQESGSTLNQVRKFLATAIWLQDRNKASDVKTGDVSKALRDSRQSRLTNAADCLNQNVGKGFCEKTGSGFFVTVEGRASFKS